MNLTLNLLRTTIVAPPSNASKWQMGFNSAFKGLNLYTRDVTKSVLEIPAVSWRFFLKGGIYCSDKYTTYI